MGSGWQLVSEWWAECGLANALARDVKTKACNERVKVSK